MTFSEELVGAPIFLVADRLPGQRDERLALALVLVLIAVIAGR